MLWECPCSRNVWALCCGKIQKCSDAVSDFFSLFRILVDRLTPDVIVKCAMVSWAIWIARNKFYFDKVQRHLIRILDEALGFLEEYQRLCATQSFFNLLLWFSCYTPVLDVSSSSVAVCICFSLVWGHTAILVLDYSLFT